MRTTIVVLVGVALGVITGGLGARARVVPDLADAHKRLGQVIEDQQRMGEELAFSTESLKWAKLENDTLRDQVMALQQAKGLPVQEGALSAPQPEAGGAIAPVSGGHPPASANPNTAGGFVEGKVTPQPLADGSDPLEKDQVTPVELERKSIEDILVNTIEEAKDQGEADRASQLYQYLQQTRDLYGNLQNAKNADERRECVDQIMRTRLNMKTVIADQRGAMVRERLAEAGVTDQKTQQQIADAFNELQDSPYYNEPMLMWGMGARHE